MTGRHEIEKLVDEFLFGLKGRPAAEELASWGSATFPGGELRWDSSQVVWRSYAESAVIDLRTRLIRLCAQAIGEAFMGLERPKP